MKGCTPGPTTIINVGTVGHPDTQRAIQAIKALRALGVTAAVAAKSLSIVKDSFDEFVSDERPYMREMIEDVKTERHICVKPQPFWTQQGRRKKGGRGRY